MSSLLLSKPGVGGCLEVDHHVNMWHDHYETPGGEAQRKALDIMGMTTEDQPIRGVLEQYVTKTWRRHSTIKYSDVFTLTTDDIFSLHNPIFPARASDVGKLCASITALKEPQVPLKSNFVLTMTCFLKTNHSPGYKLLLHTLLITPLIITAILLSGVLNPDTALFSVAYPAAILWILGAMILTVRGTGTAVKHYGGIMLWSKQTALQLHCDIALNSIKGSISTLSLPPIPALSDHVREALKTLVKGYNTPAWDQLSMEYDNVIEALHTAHELSDGYYGEKTITAVTESLRKRIKKMNTLASEANDSLRDYDEMNSQAIRRALS